MSNFLRVEDLIVYQRLCELHLEVCILTKRWPVEERFELCSQIRRSSNSAAAQLAEEHSDRHIRNKIEGANRARGEALESEHHLYIAFRKGYVDAAEFDSYRDRYHECVRTLNGLERKLESQFDSHLRRFPAQAASGTLNPEP